MTHELTNFFTTLTTAFVAVFMTWFRMTMVRRSILIRSAALALLVLTSTACSPARFETKKTEFLKRTGVFGCQESGGADDGCDASMVDASMGVIQTNSGDGASASLPTATGSGAGASGNLPANGMNGANGSLPANGMSGANGSLPTGSGTGASGSLPANGMSGASGILPIGGITGASGILPIGGVTGAGGSVPASGGGSAGSNASGALPSGTSAATSGLPTALPTTLYCSTNNGPEADSNARVTNATSLKVRILSSSGQIVCESVSSATVLRQHKVDLGSCANKVLPAGFYSVQLLNQAGVDLVMAETGSQIQVRSDGKVYSNEELTMVFFDYNPGRPNERSEGGPTRVATEGALCDIKSSPLFIDMRNLFAETGSFNLSSPADGVWFDIMGENAEPVAHTPYRISWFQNRGFAFITLPNAAGEVKGINELFGDNTRGPDGRFAANGYLALAKYDDGDGRITAKDAVFAKLRLWFDVNQNGRADAGELMTLQRAGITMIDLDYDASFKEVDRYGNEVKYKSVALTRHGDFRLVFDVWFDLRYQGH